jgi:hypothetical protein
MLKLNLRSVVMKKIVMASAVVAATAMASDMDSRPEASVPTPVEAREALNNVPKLSEKENVDWQKLREERRAAREQILKDLRNKTAIEKNEMREASVKSSALEMPLPLIDKMVEKPKEELVREQKMNEIEQMKGPHGFPPFGPPMPPMGRPEGKQVCPFNPYERGKKPKVEPIKPFGWK